MMDKSSNIQKKGKSLYLNGITITGLYSPFIPNAIEAIFKNPFFGPCTGLNYFMNLNRGEGPPGGCCSPETECLPLPDYNIAACNGCTLNRTKQKFHQITQYHFSKFYHASIFIHN